MLHVKLLRNYRSKKGTPTFVYEVSGKESDLESFKTAQGEFYRESDDNGAPLWFTTRCIGDAGTLIVTTAGKIVADMSEFDKAASLSAQYGGNFGEQLARMSAEKALGNSTNAIPDTSAAQQQEEPAAEEQNLGDV